MFRRYECVTFICPKTLTVSSVSGQLSAVSFVIFDRSLTAESLFETRFATTEVTQYSLQTLRSSTKRPCEAMPESIADASSMSYGGRNCLPKLVSPA